jgi:LysM repeat protein
MDAGSGWRELARQLARSHPMHRTEATVVARYRTRRRKRINWGNVGVLTLGVAALWWAYPLLDPLSELDQAEQSTPRPVLETDRPEVPQAGPVRTEVVEKGATDPSTTPAKNAQTRPTDRVRNLVVAGKDALARGDSIAARAHFSEAMSIGVTEPDASMLRAELTRIGTESIFSPRIFENDPFVERYVIKTGDSLAKIAKSNKVSADLLASINGIRDKNLIRAGQTIKIIHGPFRAVVHKRDFSLDVYLADTFVKHHRVGLGSDNSTPTGTWKVGTKLKNPTYYPPRGGSIVTADDPANPLGERWIGLIGVSGEAIGQQRYGVHGTNEPESIGKSVSMGCIRMYNEDVEAVYSYLVPMYSTVTVVE